MFTGAWTVIVLAFLLLKFRLSLFHMIVSAGFLCVFGFLMFAPVRLNPLVFVEMQMKALI